MGGFRFNTLMLGGLVLVSLGAIRSLFNLAKSRDGVTRLETRRRLTAARDFFARELRRPAPALDDAWFPYLLAFGLDADADRWFRSFGSASGVAPAAASTIGTFSDPATGARSSSPDRASSSSRGGAWTGGMGGRSGGAGASGTWAVAVTQLAQGVSSPSSSGSGISYSSSGGSSSGGGSSGGSSGGGGAGGW